MKVSHTFPLFSLLFIYVLLSCHNKETSSSMRSMTPDDENRPVKSSADHKTSTVYFSYDNGITWENKSEGLPAGIHVGLGGLATNNVNLALMSQEVGLFFFNERENRWDHIPTHPVLLANNPGAMQFFHGDIYVGSQYGGVFFTHNEGKTWTMMNAGLDNLTVRKFAIIEEKLYAATNSGLYALNIVSGCWELEYGPPALQVNGMTTMNGHIYIATNQGAFASPVHQKKWKKIYSNGALHNISSDDKFLYAMVYNELFSSPNQGTTWMSIQKGLPTELYTFNVIEQNRILLAGQWDGVYTKSDTSEAWIYSGLGLPDHLAVSNLLDFNGILVAAGNERQL